jgi:hypothetical protein
LRPFSPPWLLILALVLSLLLLTTTAEEVQVEVKVVDELGRPLAGASVSVTRPRPAPSLLWTGKTDSYGNFSLSVEPGTPMLVHVDWMGVIVAEVLANADPRGFIINASVRDLSIKVLDHRGRPVQGCEVSASWQSPTGPISRSNSTNELGLTTIEKFPSSAQLALNMTLRARRLGVELTTPISFDPRVDGWNLTLRCELYDLRVRVLDRMRNPVAGALVEASMGSQKVVARADEDGFAYILQLPSGLYELEATFESYRWSAQVRIDNDSSVDIVLPFAKSYNVTLLFKWDDGRPGSGLRVLLRSGFSDLEVTTDASGASSLSLYPGVYNVTVSKGSSRLWDFSIEVRADTKKEFILNSSLRLNELTVRLRSSEGRVIDGTVVVSREGVEVGRASTSGGSAKLLLSDGLYRVVAQAQGYDVSEAEISLNSDQELELRLSPTPSPLSSPIVSIAIVACVALVTFAVARSLFSKRRE